MAGIVERLCEFAAKHVHATCLNLSPEEACRALFPYGEPGQACEEARALLAEATPEVVRLADAALVREGVS